MAAQTITTTVNFDSPSVLGLLNGEAITVNGGALTIDSDVRWNQNAAVFGSIAVSTTLGGSVLFEGRNVWELPYTAATGNVPAQNALGSNSVAGGTSGATGELLRVWASGSLTPAAAGGAMPASGWVKLRSKTGNFQTGEVVTLPGGATITISNAGKRSWLHIVGAEAGAISIPGLADVQWRGDLYELGETSAADDQTFAFPVADSCPAVWIEKSVGAYEEDGLAGLEPWLNAGVRWGTATQQVATDARGKYFGQNLTTGVITIAQRSSNACGFKPAAGLRVFVPNLILSSSTSANWSANTIALTSMGVRYETDTTGGGKLDVHGVSANWYFNAESARIVKMRRCALSDALRISKVPTPPDLEDIVVGLSPSTTNHWTTDFTTLLGGLRIRRLRTVRVLQGVGANFSDVYGLDCDGVQFDCFGALNLPTRSSDTYANFNRVTGVLTHPVTVGMRIRATACQSLFINSLEYADRMVGTTDGLTPNWAVSADSGSGRIVVDGFSAYAGLADLHPYSGIMAAYLGSSDCELLNVGTPTQPYNCGTGVSNMGSAMLAAGINSLARRVYLIGNRAEPVSLSSSTPSPTLINVWGGTSVNQTIDSTNAVVRGCKWAPVSQGQAAVYGTHWQDQFTGLTSGAITISCNEPTTATEGEVTTTLAAGSGWTSAGGLRIATEGDSATWTMGYFALGHTSLANSAPTITGTNVANHALQFQADTGSGWSTWAALTGPNLAEVGAINPAVGVRLRVRATVTTASASNLLTNIRIDTVTDATSQQVQYPITAAYTLTLDNVAVGSLVHVETTAGAAVYSVTAAASTVVLPLQAYESGSPLNNLRIKVRKGSATPFYQPWETLATATPGSASIYVSQIPDE